MTPAVKRLAAVHIFCTVVKRGAAAWSASRSQSRMEAPERARSMVARAAGQPHFCLATERLCGPPGRGDFLVSNFHPGAIPGTLRRSWRGNGGGLFLATSLEKIFGGVIAMISFRPGGWMQQSAVPRCAILSQPRHAPGLLFCSVPHRRRWEKAREPLDVAAPAALLP